MSELRRILLRPSVLSVLLIVALWNVLASSEKLARAIERPGTLPELASGLKDVNIGLQDRMYQALFSLFPYKFRPHHVTLVFIDDAAHWSPPLWGSVPTQRAYLAELISRALESDPKPRVIGLDVELISPIDVPGVDDPKRQGKDENLALLDAIKTAWGNKVPVVIATAFGTRDDGSNVRLAGIFKDSDLPPPLSGCASGNSIMGCPGFGYVNAPQDRRQIPLAEEVYPWDGSSGASPMSSFALAVVNADIYGGAARGDPVILDAWAHHTALYGTFVKETAFKGDEKEQNYVVDATSLHDGDHKAIKACAQRIVLIGGRWHELPPEYGSLVDMHFSPVGWISGLSFHANYIESLENGWYRHGVPTWIAVLIDLLVGLMIYVGFASFTGLRKFAALALLFFFVPFLAYISLINFNRYLDFLFPMELYVIHLAYEAFKDLWMKRNALLTKK